MRFHTCGNEVTYRGPREVQVAPGAQNTQGARQGECLRVCVGGLPGPARLSDREEEGAESMCVWVWVAGGGGRPYLPLLHYLLSLSLRKVSPPTFSPPFSLYPPRVPAIVWGSLFSISFSHVWGSKSKKGPFLLPPEMDRRTLHLQCTCCALLIYCCTAATLKKKAKLLLSTASCSSPPD